MTSPDCKILICLIFWRCFNDKRKIFHQVILLGRPTVRMMLFETCLNASLSWICVIYFSVCTRDSNIGQIFCVVYWLLPQLFYFANNNLKLNIQLYKKIPKFHKGFSKFLSFYYEVTQFDLVQHLRLHLNSPRLNPFNFIFNQFKFVLFHFA